MSKQKHDLGYQKRRWAEAHQGRTADVWRVGALNRLAQDLVRRGVASPVIVGKYRPSYFIDYDATNTTEGKPS
ncbi:hypothetical protein N866_14285 [Actinotalea ferrariae CF5-4]|uniref:Uncharacterized protein n=1 Tax=Actinotalea ferrariae CF5-4 TaxID=948458 RepID=A0A021VS89_9CELL|nr:hypothetical protein [Actinotalea ferrariae]EYR61922.1 hypothetical protein N866_14285 [Actinotalea ferrariae CF5-4]